MYKEIMIIIVVIVIVMGIDVISRNYTEEAVAEISSKLNELKIEILNENLIASKDKMKEVMKIWKERYNILAYYIEHDELEKVETELTRLSADIDMKEYKHCINELNTTIFILNHIKQKEEFDIKSVF